MAGKKPEHTTIGKDLLRNGSGVVTAADVEAAAAAAKTPAKKATPPRKKPPAKKRAPRTTTKPPPPIEAWDQREDETGPAYAAFVVYRDLGLTRSLARVRTDWGTAGAHLGVKATPPSATSIELWSSKYSWLIRVSAYDRWLDRAWQLEVKERKRKAARRNADMASEAMDLVAARISQMTKHFDLTSEEYDKERPPPLDVLDLRRLVDSLGKLERLALGEATENVQVTGKDGKDLVPDLTSLSAGDLRDRLQQIRDTIDKRLADATGATE
jgi:hypothetical protein